MSIDMNPEIVSEMGLLSQLAYLEYGSSTVYVGSIINQFDVGKDSYSLNNSYKVITHTPVKGDATLFYPLMW